MNLTYSATGQKNLVGGAATTVLTITPLSDGESLGGAITAFIHADDGTDFQAVADHFVFAAIRTEGAAGENNGSMDVQIQAVPSSIAAGSAGILTTTWTIVQNGNGFDIKCNAVSSLAETTLKVHYHLVLHGTFDDISIS
jgi:hypothetical protein